MNFLQQSNASFLLVPNERVLDRKSPLYAQVMAKLARLWNVHTGGPLAYNPCANPVSLERHHLSTLLEREYVVAEKSDGVRYALALLELDSAGAPLRMALMIDRNLDVFEVRVNAPLDDFVTGSVFDGELVWDETDTALGRRHVFYVFDVIAYGGACVRGCPFVERHRIARKKFSNPDDGDAIGVAALDERITTPGSAHRLMFCCKRFYSLHQFDIAAGRPVRHSSDGFIFVPRDGDMPLNRANDWYKWKRTHNVDIDVHASWNADELRWRVCMFYLDGDVLHDASRFETTTMHHSSDGAPLCLRLTDGNSTLGTPIDNVKEIRHVWELACDRIERTSTGWIAECHLHAVRWDKSAPNNALTIERSLASAADPVRLDELRQIGIGASYRPSGSGE